MTDRHATDEIGLNCYYAIRFNKQEF